MAMLGFDGLELISALLPHRRCVADSAAALHAYAAAHAGGGGAAVAAGGAAVGCAVTLTTASEKERAPWHGTSARQLGA